MDDLAEGIRRKVLLRLIVPLVVLTFFGSLDRVNVSFAARHMNADIGLDPALYGLGVGLFFVSYILFQVPSALVLRRFGARRWIAGSLLLWGLFAGAIGLIDSVTPFMILRFLLGIAEAGFAPGIVFIISQWVPRRFRASSMAAPMLAIPLSIILGGPLCGWLISADNPLGLEGWRWMFLAEGGATIALGLACWFYFVDRPSEVAWLSAADKAFLADEATADARANGPADRRAGIWQHVNVPTLATSAVWFCLLGGAYGITFWLPLIVEHMIAISPFEVGLINALPWIGIGAGMWFNARHSDKTGERFWHLVIPALVAAGGIVGAGLAGATPLALVLLTIGGAGLGSAQGVFWALPTSFLRGTGLAAGIAFINVFGSSAGVVVPFVVGAVRQATGSFVLPIFLLAAMIGCVAILLTIIRASPAGAELRDRRLDPARH